MKFLMCPPEYFEVSYSINPWMDPTCVVDKGLAQSQWDNLCSVIKSLGAEIELVEPVKGLPDMVFTANAGFLVDPDRAILSHFYNVQRRYESSFFKEWFHTKNILTWYPEYSMEGAGDLFAVADKLIMGYGQRSSAKSLAPVARFSSKEVVAIKLTHPKFYHLDLAFSPLDETTAMVSSYVMDKKSVASICSIFPDPIFLTKEQTSKFMTNSVVIDRTILMPACDLNLNKRLRQRGYDIIVCEVSEFIKAGGALRCLTLQV